jgi:hypothetical protein
MINFFTFKTFITPSLLLVTYYIGGLFIIWMSWHIVLWLKKAYLKIEHYTTFQQRFLATVFFVAVFVFMQMGWRMVFEFLIAYFDMHEALLKLAH